MLAAHETAVTEERAMAENKAAGHQIKPGPSKVPMPSGPIRMKHLLASGAKISGQVGSNPNGVPMPQGRGVNNDRKNY
jgi:hypothetical protein